MNYVPGISSLDMNGKNYESGQSDHEAENPDEANFPVYIKKQDGMLFSLFMKAVVEQTCMMRSMACIIANTWFSVASIIPASCPGLKELIVTLGYQ